MKRSHAAFSFIVVAALVVSACSSGDSSNGDPTVPIPTAGTSPTSTTSTSTPSSQPATASTTTSTSSATSDTPTSAPTTTGGPPTTLIRPADLVTDPNDPNNLHTSLPEHQPIIDAYIAAVNAQLITYSRWPLDPTSPELAAAPITEQVLQANNDGMVERTQKNQVLDISGGVTLRPYVVENDDPTRAFVWDCQIDATFWKDKDTGEKAPPDAWPNMGPPGVETGVVAVMVLVDGRWLLDDGGLEPQACE
ncbi:MAG: hypothetical protein FD127_1775 [Acidimicrobiaceae bacterium]|nr:MAG: hypothetical protein FD127_1775 [Acidimicrobiaceae bacterium]